MVQFLLYILPWWCILQHTRPYITLTALQRAFRCHLCFQSIIKIAGWYSQQRAGAVIYYRCSFSGGCCVITPQNNGLQWSDGRVHTLRPAADEMFQFVLLFSRRLADETRPLQLINIHVFCCFIPSVISFYSLLSGQRDLFLCRARSHCRDIPGTQQLPPVAVDDAVHVIWDVRRVSVQDVEQGWAPAHLWPNKTRRRGVAVPGGGETPPAHPERRQSAAGAQRRSVCRMHQLFHILSLYNHKLPCISSSEAIGLHCKNTKYHISVFKKAQIQAAVMHALKSVPSIFALVYFS